MTDPNKPVDAVVIRPADYRWVLVVGAASTWLYRSPHIHPSLISSEMRLMADRIDGNT